jgi:hypothetical protein
VVPARLAAVGAVVLGLAAGLLTATSGPLYAEVYPTTPPGDPGIARDSNRLTAQQFVTRYQDALTNAKVKTETRPARVVQYERSTLLVRLVLGMPSGGEGLPTVAVAWENEGVLHAEEEGAVEVAPDEPVVKSLDECAPRREGGCEVTWEWTITPRQAGTQRLLLTVSPLVYVDGQLSEKFKRRNASIPVDVLVHPVVAEFEAASATLPHLKVDGVPHQVSAGSSLTVTASLPGSWGDTDDLDADIVLTTDPDSAGASITRLASGPVTSGTVSRSWSVEPTGTGVLRLVFTSTVSGQAGDKALSTSLPVAMDVTVTGTIWDRIGGLAAWLGALVTLALGVLALGKYWRDRRAAGPGAR